MSNQLKNQSLNQSSFNSRNDGFRVKTNIEQLKDRNSFAVRLDVEALPVPPRRYLADFCFVEGADDFVNLYFCERKLFNDELKTCLTIRFPLNELEDILPSIDSLKNIRVDLLTECNMRNEPEQHVKLISNIAFIAVNGPEACIDFYHVSAFSKEHLKTLRNELGVEPIVRVDLSSKLLEKLVYTLHHFIELKKQEGETK